MTSIKIILVSSLIFGLNFKNPGAVSFEPMQGFTRPTIRDSLPRLDAISEEDIDTVITSYKNQTITIKLKNNASYIYPGKAWMDEWNKPGINPRIQKAIGTIDKVFTKTEQAPAFPGGNEAWDKYMHEFCIQNKAVIDDYGPATFVIRFIVDIDGEVSNVRVIFNNPKSELDWLARRVIENCPRWVPAHQNGHPVVSYCSQTVKLVEIR